MGRLLVPVCNIRVPTVAPPEVEPDDVTSVDLKAWYKAEDFDGDSDGDEPTAWLDVSGNGFNATPLGSTGNQPVVRLNAINSTMTALACNDQRGFVTGELSLSSYHNWTIFAVVKFTSENTTQSGFFTFNDGLSGGAGFDTGIGRDSTGKLRFNNFDSSVILTSSTFTLNAWHYIVMRSNGGGDGNVDLRIDGVLFPFASVFPDQGANVGALRLMEQRNASGHLMIGLAAEFAVFDGKVTDDERLNNLERYAHRRYGI